MLTSPQGQTLFLLPLRERKRERVKASGVWDAQSADGKL